MFKIAKEQTTVAWPVKVQVPQPGGKFVEQKFSADLLILDQAETEEIIKQDGGDVNLLRTVVKGASELQDQHGEPIAFEPKVLELLISIPYVRVAMVEAYFDAASGGAKRKNK